MNTRAQDCADFASTMLGLVVLLPLFSYAQLISSSESTLSATSSDAVSASVSEEFSTLSASSSLESTLPSSSASSDSSLAAPTGRVSTPAAVPGFPATDPLNPPSVDRSPGLDADNVVVPDFSAAWERALNQAKEHVTGLTLDEKVRVATGSGSGARCVGNIPPVGSWNGLCLQDGPLGVRSVDFVTSFPPEINAAATFNRRLIRQRGLFMGVEHVGKGVNIALGPMMNPMRIPAAGRNWEGFGADTFLNGEASYETILGMQSAGVQACAKHFIDNEQERKRTTSSSVVDERTQHQVYAHPFLRSVQAGVTSVMCSYNQVNGTYACENDHVLNGILKHEFGFRGFVVSDWGATHSTLSVNAGLDMTMPDGRFFGNNLVTAVGAGSVSEERIDDMVIRILGGFYLLQQEASTFPSVTFDSNRPHDDSRNEHIDVQGLSDSSERKNVHASLVQEMGSASTVLLKNVKNGSRWGGGPRGLPFVSLSKLRSLVVVGSDAAVGTIGPNQFRNQQGTDGILAMGWGSGVSNFTHLISPLESIQRRAKNDRTSVSWILDDVNGPRAGNMAINQGAAIVFLQANSGEGSDRPNLNVMNNGDLLVQSVAAQNNNTIVVIHSVGPVIMESWVEHPNVTAVVWAGLPGQEAGDSLAQVLWGDYNPSGRLPFTLARREADYPAQIDTSGGQQDIITITYTERLLVDYKWFDARNITPRFEFGFGLSYTEFAYSSLTASLISTPPASEEDAALEEAWQQGRPSPTGLGSSAAFWLHRPFIRVEFSITNAGDTAGTEIPQLYLHMPPSSGEPPSSLRGFTDVHLQPGSSETVKLSLSRYDLSIWNDGQGGWMKPNGTFNLSVGASSRDLRLRRLIPV